MIDFVYDTHQYKSVPFHEAFEVVLNKLLERKANKEYPFHVMTDEEVELTLSENIDKFFKDYGYLKKEYY